jgi:ubiquinone/menaquinone biosynthesis C-methylase UbiE
MTAKSADPTETGIDWASGEIAEQWSRNQASRDQHIGPATEMMLDLADIKAGYRVLDVAAGTGGQTLLAARRVGPNGYVLATDLSSSMLKVCAENVQKAGLANVEARVMDAQDLDLEEDSFDAVICRTGLMLLSDPPRALRGMRRAMKRGGKISVLVFSTAEKNPYQGVPLTVVRRLGGVVPSMFALGEPSVLESTFRDGGFPVIDVQAVGFRRDFSSVIEVIRSLREAIFLREPMAKLSHAECERAWAEIERELGQREGPDGLELPGELLIGVGTK